MKVKTRREEQRGTEVGCDLKKDEECFGCLKLCIADSVV